MQSTRAIAAVTCSLVNCSPSSTDPVPIIPKPNCLLNTSPTTVCSLTKSAIQRLNRFGGTFLHLDAQTPSEETDADHFQSGLQRVGFLSQERSPDSRPSLTG